MTITNPSARNDYVGNGAADTFPFTFRITDAAHLRVIVEDTDGNIDTLTLNADYTVTGVGLASGGSITLTAGPLEDGYKLTILPSIPITQLTDLRNRGSFFPSVHEDALDKLTLISQQQQDEINRAIKFPATDGVALKTVIPSAAARANQFLGFDAQGEPIAARPSEAPVSVFMQAVVSAASSSTAAAALGLASTSDPAKGAALVGFRQSSSGAKASPSTVQGALSRAFGLLPMGGLTFFDTFSRADTADGDLGTSESGHAWDLRGAYAGSYPLPAATGGKIEDGMFVLDPSVATVCYATYTFDETVTRIGARISWVPNAGSVGSTFAMVSSVNSNFISDMLHFTVNRSGWKLQVREAGGPFVDLVTGSFSPVLADDGTIYTFEVIFSGRSATVNCNGKVASVYDSRIPNNIGRYAFWEIFYNSSTPVDRVRVHAVWAGSTPHGEYIGNARHSASTGITEYQGALASVAGIINCVGKTDVEATITAAANPSATGGFRRSCFRWLNHTLTNGWIAENKGDGVNNLVWSHLRNGSSQDVLSFYRQGLGYANIQNNITAFAGGGQAGATALTGQICRVTTVGTAGDSVKLPAATGSGLAVLVINSAANSCDVFPQSGERIDDGTPNAAVAVAGGGRTWFYDLAPGLWYSV